MNTSTMRFRTIGIRAGLAALLVSLALAIGGRGQDAPAPDPGEVVVAPYVPPDPNQTEDTDEAPSIGITFPTTMVTTDQVGKTVTNPPIQINPPLPGTYTWKSQSLLVLSPKQPQTPGQTYTMTAAPGSADLAGHRETLSTWKYALVTPELKATAVNIGGKPPQDALGIRPQVDITFDGFADPETVSKIAYFQDDTG
jgi:hypothetical protein